MSFNKFAGCNGALYRTRLFVIAGLTLVANGCAPAGAPQVVGDAAAEAPTADPAVEQAGCAGEPTLGRPLDVRAVNKAGRMPTATDADYRRSLRTAVGSTGDTLVTISLEREPGADDWYESAVEWSVGQHVRALASRLSHELYLATSPNAGAPGQPTDIVSIERWNIAVADGEWYSFRPRYLGAPLDPYSTPPTQFLIKNGAFVPPELRPRQSVTRTVIWAGQSLVPSAMACDPDGRFVLILDGESDTIYQLATTPGSTPNAIADAGTYPMLAKCTGFRVGDHTALGRVFRVLADDMDGDYGVFLIDGANDTAFESVMELDHGTYVSSGLATGWQADYHLKF